MKFCFLINSAPFLSEFLGKISSEALNDNHEVVVVVNSKVAEYTKKQHFPEQVRWISKVDWCVEHFDPSKKEFGSFSWREFFPAFGRYTRLRWDYAYSVDTVSQLCQFFDFVFRTEKPDIVLGEPPTGVFGNIAHHFAKQYRVPVFGLTDSRLNIAVYDSESTDSRFEKTFKKLSLGNITGRERADLSALIKKIVSHVEKPAYMGYAKIAFSPIAFVLHYLGRLSELKPVIRYFSKRKVFSRYDYESEVTWRRMFASPFELLLRQVRLFSQKRFFSLMNEHDQFFVYPLHLEPEAATLVLAAPYADQMATIRSIAFSLPFPFKLYVKEHPSAMGLRPDGFYQELQKVPNVVLISPEQNVPKLMQKSQGIITLSSTMGFEALFLGKPVYVLGNVFYAYHPLCQKVQGFDDLKKRLEADQKQKPKVDDLEGTNLCFMASYVRNTLKGGTMYALGPKDTNDYKAFFKALLQRI